MQISSRQTIDVREKARFKPELDYHEQNKASSTPPCTLVTKLGKWVVEIVSVRVCGRHDRRAFRSGLALCGAGAERDEENWSLS